MTGTIEIRLKSPSGAVIGAGPITAATRFSLTEPVDRVGSFQFSIAANDPDVSRLTAQTRIEVIYFDPIQRRRALVGDGIIRSRQTGISGDGMPTVTIGGPGLGQELSDDIVQLSLDGAGGSGVLDAPKRILDLFPGWELDPSGRLTTETRFYGAFSGESGLEALVAIAEKLGEHFVILPGRRVKWLGSAVRASGVRATTIDAPDRTDESGEVIAIQRIEQTASSEAILTRITPYGAGDGDARLTLAASNWTAPAGFTIDRGRNEIVNTALEGTVGKIRRTVQFKDIGPVSNTDADLRSAANQLAIAAHAYMKKFAAEQRTYQIDVIGLGADRVRPGESIRLDVQLYHDGECYFSVREDFAVLSITKEFDESGSMTPKLEISNIINWIQSDRQVLARAIRDQIAAQAHPQLSANCWWLSFSPRMDKSNKGTIAFWLTKEIVTVNEITLYFKILPLESSVKGVGGKQTTSGPSSSSTSAVDGGAAVTSGPSSRETSESAKDMVVGQGLAGANAIYISRKNIAGETDFGANIPNHKHAAKGLYLPDISVPVPDHQHWIKLQGHTHRMDHTHEVSVPSHSHGMNHTHEFTAKITTEYGIFRNSTGKTLKVEELTITANGQAVGTIENAGGGWYKVDITGCCTNAIGRPTKENHSIVFTTEAEDKSGLIDAKLKVRSVIQAIAYL